MQHRSEEAVPRDTLRNQLDHLQAQFESLNSKLAAIVRVGELDQQARSDCEQSIRATVHSTLDGIHHLASSLLAAQMLSLVQCLRKQSDCQTFFHLQLRQDALLSMVRVPVVPIIFAFRLLHSWLPHYSPPSTIPPLISPSTGPILRQ